MHSIRSYIYRKKHRSGKITFVVRWFDPSTSRWMCCTGGRTKSEASIVEARVREKLLKGPETQAYLFP